MEMTTLQTTEVDNPQLNKTDIDTRTTAQIVICALVLIAIIVIDLLSNTAILIAVLTQHKLKEQVSNMFIVNLAIADLGNAIFVMLPSLTSLISDNWMMEDALCNLNCAVNYCLIIVSMTTLAAISIDRYQSVLNPLTYITTMTRRKISCMIVFIWIQATAFAIAPIIMQWIHYDYWEVVCAIDWQRDHAVDYVISAFILCFIIPAAVMSFCYFKIVRSVRNSSKMIQPEGINNNLTVRVNKQTQKIIHSLLVVVALFFICMTPFCVTKLLKVVAPDNTVPGLLNLMASWIEFLGSAVNPFIYGIFRKDFRSAFRIIWFKATCRSSFIGSLNDTSVIGERTMLENLKKKYSAERFKNVKPPAESPYILPDID